MTLRGPIHHSTEPARKAALTGEFKRVCRTWQEVRTMFTRRQFNTLALLGSSLPFLGCSEEPTADSHEAMAVQNWQLSSQTAA
jgi:hypothetical protein